LYCPSLFFLRASIPRWRHGYWLASARPPQSSVRRCPFLAPEWMSRGMSQRLFETFLGGGYFSGYYAGAWVAQDGFVSCVCLVFSTCVPVPRGAYHVPRWISPQKERLASLCRKRVKIGRRWDIGDCVLDEQACGGPAST
jgi:hypothetical protein